jgi:hypothetical protein
MIEAENTSGGSPVAAPDDGSVIEGLRRGGKIAFCASRYHYHASPRRVARLYIFNRAVADEVVPDTWVGAIQGMWRSRAARHSGPGSSASSSRA